jgi:hypothetical protein
MIWDVSSFLGRWSAAVTDAVVYLGFNVDHAI